MVHTNTGISVINKHQPRHEDPSYPATVICSPENQIETVPAPQSKGNWDDISMMDLGIMIG